MQIYVIERPDGLVKIGRSINRPQRIRSRETQGGFTTERVWISFPGSFEAITENRAHKAMKPNRQIGEWFDVDFDDAVTAVLNTDSNTDSSSKDMTSDLRWFERAKILLNNKGISVKDLASVLGVTASAAGHYLSGRRDPSPDMLKLIADTLGASIDDLF